jgi:DNA gyrase subunit A
MGVINFKVSAKTGSVIGGMPVTDADSLILLTSTSKIIRLGMEEVRSVGRATMGVRLVKLDDGARVVGFDTVADAGSPGEGTDVSLPAGGEGSGAGPAQQE